MEFECETILHPSKVHEVSAPHLLPALAPVQDLFDNLVVVALAYVVRLLHLEILGDGSQYAGRNRQVNLRFRLALRGALGLVGLVVLGRGGLFGA